MDNNSAEISMQISWVYTEDLDSTAYFYAEKLGLACIREAGQARLFATTSNAAIGLCGIFDERVVEPKGGMISLLVDDVDACYQRLCGRGVEIEMPPRRFEQFGIYHFFVADPNGYLIEFQQFLPERHR